MDSKKNGFTLIEIIATIIILGLLVTISVGVIINSIGGAKENINSGQKELLFSTAKLYFDDNVDINTVGEEYNVCIQEDLVENGYLEEFKDSSGNNIKGTIILKIIKEDNVITDVKAIALSEGSEDDCGNVVGDGSGDDVSNSNPCGSEEEETTEEKENTLACKILGINYMNVSGDSLNLTNEDRGLFEQWNDEAKSIDGKPTYYFRGSSTNDTIKPGYTMNNYVKMAGLIWRVVRINEDGTIKIITQDSISTNKINYFTDGADAKLENSPILSELANLETTLLNSGSLELIDTNSTFCNDTNTAIKNLSNASFVCPSGYNYDYFIGLITADEMLYAGADNTTNTDNITYLNNNTEFWTMTGSGGVPYRWNPDSYGIYFDYNLEEGYAPPTAFVRAVVNLKANTVVTDGDGLSAETAYVIED